MYKTANNFIDQRKNQLSVYKDSYENLIDNQYHTSIDKIISAFVYMTRRLFNSQTLLSENLYTIPLLCGERNAREKIATR